MLKNAKNLYVIMAVDVIVDASDQTNTITKIIDKFNIGINKAELVKSGVKLGAQPIAPPINYAIATSWVFDEPTKSDSFVSLKLNFIDPNGKNLGEIPQQENVMPKGFDRINLNCNINGLLVTTPGKYQLRVDLVDKAGKVLGTGEYPYQVEIDFQ
jgi:hypothetical protein